MKGIEIQIKAITPNSSWMDESVHPATVHRHSPVSVLISQAGVSDFISGSFAEYGHFLLSKDIHVHSSARGIYREILGWRKVQFVKTGISNYNKFDRR